MSNEKWSEWKPHDGRSVPISDSVEFEYRMRTGMSLVAGSPASEYKDCFEHENSMSDIVAYRYRIQENEMRPDLKWLALNVSEWPSGQKRIAIDPDGEVRFLGGGISNDFMPDNRCSGLTVVSAFIGNENRGYTQHQWLQARKDLGLIMSDDEESLPAEEWSTTITDTPEEAAMVEDMVNGKRDMVNAPPHYQLRPGYEVYDLRQDLAAKAANGGATYAQYSDWDRATEYLLRMWGKNKLEDLKKCRWYVDKLIEKLEAE